MFMSNGNVIHYMSHCYVLLLCPIIMSYCYVILSCSVCRPGKQFYGTGFDNPAPMGYNGGPPMNGGQHMKHRGRRMDRGPPMNGRAPDMGPQFSGPPRMQGGPPPNTRQQPMNAYEREVRVASPRRKKEKHRRYREFSPQRFDHHPQYDGMMPYGSNIPPGPYDMPNMNQM